MQYEVKVEGKFKYIETLPESKEAPLVLLHGLMGGLSNFNGIIEHFGKRMNVVLPTIPIYEMPIISISMNAYVEHIQDFIRHKGYDKVHVLGNSLGGHIALMYMLSHPEKVKSGTLTGSSGLYESAMGNTYPKRGDYEYIKKKTEDVFFNPAIATKELVDEIFTAVSDRNKAIRIVATSKSAIRHNVGDKLHQIKMPTLLVWGKQDSVTPPFVGEKFHELIEGSKLVWIDECGHASMMEHPEKFNAILEEFLNNIA